MYTIFKELILLLWLFGLEVPHAAESLEIWSSCPDGSILSTSGRGTKYVGCAVASAVVGCGKANLISGHRSDAIELQLHSTDLQQHYLFRAGHDLKIEHRFLAR